MPTPPSVRALVLAVDDDPAVGRAIERDLRQRYGARHRVLLADSGAAGLEMVEQIIRRGEPVALLVADQRMPGMSGVEFLAQALRMAPLAKRVLLTAYADTDAAITAINEVRLDHYLMKPWSPPEERLYPVLDDLLEDWEADAASRTAEPGLRLIGHRFSAEAHGTRDFLARNGVPYRWLDVADPEARILLEAAGGDGTELPVLVFEDGADAGAALPGGAGRAGRPAHPGGAAVLRPGHPGRRPRRAGGGGVRGLGGPGHAARGAPRRRRAGRPELAHRELPGLSLRPQRRRPGAARDRAGAPAGRRDAHRPGGRRHPRERPLARDHAGRRRGDRGPQRAGGDGRPLRAARGARGRAAHRLGRVLRRRPRGGGRGRGRGRGRGGRGELGRAGRHRPRHAGPPRDDALPRRRPGAQHVPLPRRADPRAAQRHGPHARRW